MDWQDEAGVGRRAQSLTQALDEVERFPPPEATLQTQHYITDARGTPAVRVLPGLLRLPACVRVQGLGRMGRRSPWQQQQPQHERLPARQSYRVRSWVGASICANCANNGWGCLVPVARQRMRDRLAGDKRKLVYFAGKGNRQLSCLCRHPGACAAAGRGQPAGSGLLVCHLPVQLRLGPVGAPDFMPAGFGEQVDNLTVRGSALRLVLELQSAW